MEDFYILSCSPLSDGTHTDDRTFDTLAEAIAAAPPLALQVASVYNPSIELLWSNSDPS
jgi:hypothetical protein